jgi:hypothetical protein
MCVLCMMSVSITYVPTTLVLTGTYKGRQTPCLHANTRLGWLGLKVTNALAFIIEIIEQVYRKRYFNKKLKT